MMATANEVRAGAGNLSQTVRVGRSYRTSIEAAFDAWVNPNSLEKWFGPPGFKAVVLTHDLRVGGAWRFLMAGDDGRNFYHFGTFVDIDPPHALSFTWASEEQVVGWRDEDGNPTLVTVTFETNAVGVAVSIAHERLQTEMARRALTGGWGAGLDELGDFLENKRPL